MNIYKDIFLMFDDYFEILQCYFRMFISIYRNLWMLFIYLLIKGIVNSGTERIWKQKKSEKRRNKNRME